MTCGSEGRFGECELDEGHRGFHRFHNTIWPNESLAASGGLSVPRTPLYDLRRFSTKSRVVQVALPSFDPERGGVTVPPPTMLSDAFSVLSPEPPRLVQEETKEEREPSFAAEHIGSFRPYSGKKRPHKVPWVDWEDRY